MIAWPHPKHSRVVILRLVVRNVMACLVYGATLSTTIAQTSAPISSSGLNTLVSSPIQTGEVTQYNITGGTRAGTNLFHSFGQFNVPNNNIANFMNESALPTSNILGRVTSGSVSNVFGTIQTEGFGTANLFLINPAGFLFGPNATLNVGGMVAFTSADYTRLTDGGRFNASLNPTTPDLLTTAPVAAYGFLGSNPGTITIQSSQLTGAEGAGISLVGGNITIEAAAKLVSPGGQINLASSPGPGEILATTYEGAATTALGSISLSQGSHLDVSANSAGIIRIRGGALTVSDGTVAANTSNINGSEIAIDVKIVGNITISETTGESTFTARTDGVGDAGEIRIDSGKFTAEATSSGIPGVVMIDTHSSGGGKAGNLSITTGDLDVTSSGQGITIFIDTGFRGLQEGLGGNVDIVANRVNVSGQVITTGDFTSIQQNTDAAGSAGDVRIFTDDFRWKLGGIITDAGSTGVAGNIALQAKEATIERSPITAFGFQRGGIISLNADSLSLDRSSVILSSTFEGPGRIELHGHSIAIKNGSSIVSDTGGDGDAGPITINTSDHVTLSGFVQDGPIGRPTGIFSNSFGVAGVSGNAGTISITTPRLTLTDGARINTTTLANGRGGDVIINAQSVSLSGEFPSLIPEPLFSAGSIHPGGITTVTTGEACIGPCGNAGNVSITTNKLSVSNGAHIDSGTSSNGNGGLITITATDRVSISGTLSDGTPGGILSRTGSTAPDAGTGGNISLTAGQSVSIRDGAAVSASGTGPADAGNISIDAGRELGIQDSSITAEAKLASGGNIDIKAIDLIRVANGSISSSVQGGPSTAGGNITIDPKTVVLQNAQILANAEQGNGGNITITTPLFLTDPRSLVDASSQFGLNGTVTIQSPTANLSGTVGQLASKTNPPQVLLQNRCIALAGGEQSTFILAGRDTLPSEPGGWLSSPVAMEHWTGEVPEEHVSRLMVRSRGWNTEPALVMSKDETTVLSLRRLTPPGFLVRSFAGSAATGCSS